MRRHTLLLLLGVAFAGWATVAGAGDIIVICNAGVTLQAGEVRDVFIGEKSFAGAVKLAPADNGTAQTAFLVKVLKLDFAKYASIWTKKSFRDGANPPPVKSSDSEAIAYVKQTPGGCSYVVSAPGIGVTVVGKF
jgi:hypothetical protein